MRFYLQFIYWFVDNIGDSFLEEGQFIAQSLEPEEIQNLDRPVYNQIFADITTSFTLLIGIFFPSVTGEYSCYYYYFITKLIVIIVLLYNMILPYCTVYIVLYCTVHCISYCMILPYAMLKRVCNIGVINDSKFM